MMKKTVIALVMIGGLGGIMTLAGCTQMPTEKQTISEMRPQISFKMSDEGLSNGRVILDGLDVGTVGDYIAGSAALRILSGSHSLRVEVGNRIILEEKFYAGDGVNRTFIVK